MTEWREQERRRAGRATSLVILLAAFILGAAPIPVQTWASQEEPVLPPVEYKLGPKDLLDIKVLERAELNQTVRVDEDGSISLSMIGKIPVAGLSRQALEQKLAALLEEKWLKTAHVTVFIKEYQKVAVHGAVVKPGMYEIIGRMTLLQAITQAGGLTDQAMRELYIFREGPDGRQTKKTIDLVDLIDNGNQSLDVRLQPGDIVSIPIDRVFSVYVYGEVRNPGVVTFKMSKKITLLQAIAQAGGPTEWASESKVVIKRKDLAARKEIKIEVNLHRIIKGKSADVVLQEGDVVIVPQSIIL